MIRARTLAALLCLVALWLQGLAPVVAAAMPRDAGPFVVCSQGKASAATGDESPAHHRGAACDHCVLCHASAADAVADWRPAFTAFDFPVAGPLRWTLRDPVVRDRRRRESAAPRGPPRLV